MQAQEKCIGAQLAPERFVRFYFLDQENTVDAPIAFSWSACETLDLLNHFDHPDVKGCNAGSIMNRVRKHSVRSRVKSAIRTTALAARNRPHCDESGYFQPLRPVIPWSKAENR